MAVRRMFSKQIIEKDKFLTMPATAQLLYFILGLYADDEGFVDNACSLIKLLPVTEDDLKILLAKGFLILVEEYLYVITDWRINNKLDTYHYTGTIHIDALQKLMITSNKSYSLTEGVNAYNYVLSKGYNLSGEKEKKRTRKELMSSSDRTPKELILSSKKTQKEPQLSVVKLSQDKVNIDKVSEVKCISISDYINSHDELSSLDDRFVNKLTEYLKKQLSDVNYVPYCQFVYDYIINRYKEVNAKLFYSLSMKGDKISDFVNSSYYIKYEKHWPDICPVCHEYHDSLGQSDECLLDMTNITESDIEEARKFFNLTPVQKENYILEMKQKIFDISNFQKKS